MNSVSQPDNFLATPSSDSPQCVRVCQNRTCRKQGAKKVLEAFEALRVPGVTVMGSGCLGQCGNGPMVLILPDMVWYRSVRPNEVPLVVEQHLRQGQ
ncbi:MAG: (2Fe-2S) ferredoxin domain-containing protein [Scytonema sp. PMC 1069.18]|nr:(2Fe-2S) ferredoxin domain-containing protein [Scytonema sp. PMC 1069.18]MEC4883366.1 (2Fe-2S) ferredoxin domain-containing protein [Scytonema sp. PMC 1070.18]